VKRSEREAINTYTDPIFEKQMSFQSCSGYEIEKVEFLDLGFECRGRNGNVMTWISAAERLPAIQVLRATTCFVKVH
jgi:hypothetical protein